MWRRFTGLVLIECSKTPFLLPLQNRHALVELKRKPNIAPTNCILRLPAITHVDELARLPWNLEKVSGLRLKGSFVLRFCAVTGVSEVFPWPPDGISGEHS